jgi:hypothetical protein
MGGDEWHFLSQPQAFGDLRKHWRTSHARASPMIAQVIRDCTVAFMLGKNLVNTDCGEPRKGGHEDELSHGPFP